jgi:AraC-like DNA-binding protein
MKKGKPVPQLVMDAVNKIKQYIDTHPLQRISISGLTAKTFIGRNLLQRSFKHIENKTIIRYQLEKRMQEAAKLLEEGRMSVKQVALKCGYSKPTNFSSDFKKVYKKTPTQWINDNRK